MALAVTILLMRGGSMTESGAHDNPLPPSDKSRHASDHLANERTFLAWMRTGVAIIIFGFAIGRFAIAIRQFMRLQGQVARTGGLSVWISTIVIIMGVLLTLAGLHRYRQTRAQLEA